MTVRIHNVVVPSPSSLIVPYYTKEKTFCQVKQSLSFRLNFPSFPLTKIKKEDIIDAI